MYDCLSLIEMVCTFDPEWRALSKGWEQAYTKHQVKYLGGEEPGLAPLGISVGDQLLSGGVNLAFFLNLSAVSPSVLSHEPFVWAVARLRSEFERVRGLREARGEDGEGSSQEPGPSGGPDREARPQMSGLTLTDLRSDGPLGAAEELDLCLTLDKGRLRALGGSFDLLEWWSLHARSFPLLFQIAMEYLSVPASSAGVERQFSKAKWINSSSRQAMKQLTLAQLVFLRENLDLVDPQDRDRLPPDGSGGKSERGHMRRLDVRRNEPAFEACGVCLGRPPASAEF
jgi:hypothetical protein